AHRRDLARAHTEAQTAGAELDSALAQIGPGRLDALLGCVRSAIADPSRDAEGAVALLATYLRTVMAAAEPVPWTLDRELDSASAYLAFERACNGRELELVLDDALPSRPWRRYGLVSAIMSVLDDATGPLELHVEPLLGEPGLATTTVRGVDPRSR